MMIMIDLIYYFIILFLLDFALRCDRCRCLFLLHPAALPSGGVEDFEDVQAHFKL